MVFWISLKTINLIKIMELYINAATQHAWLKKDKSILPLELSGLPYIEVTSISPFLEKREYCLDFELDTISISNKDEIKFIDYELT